jgi:preprotein translocase subunit SecA
MGVLGKILKVGDGRKVRDLASLVGPINELEAGIVVLSDAELSAKTAEFRSRLADGETLDDIMIEAFAVVREACRRVLGQRPYDVQLMGAMALHFGWVAEMKTGEGKTLVSTMPVYLNALAGRGCHVVTVNDYLASRDAAWMGRVHEFLGLRVGRVSSGAASAAEKHEAYEADITYGTNTEFGFDYLRDNMARSPEGAVQRGHYYAIVDEVDSILVDEARTPLIISGPSDDAKELYQRFSRIVATLTRDRDYEVDEEKKSVMVLPEGVARVEGELGVSNLYDSGSLQVHHLEQALRAKELFFRDKDYIVSKGEVVIVDEFTGRTLEGRRWSDGLHQAIEAKERVSIKSENHTWATVTLQNYFRLYEKLGGMTGTAETEAAEFGSTYNLSVVPIPTNRETIRIDRGDLVFRSEAGKFAAIVEDVVARVEKGQPVLLGTASVVKSELLSVALSAAGITHEVLNAKQHFREAEIIAQAGRAGRVTVATNMAGRGVDILLGGNPESLALLRVPAKLVKGSGEFEEAYEEALHATTVECEIEGELVRAAGGLCVLGTERHDSRRIDNQLRGRSGRQGDPGETRFYLSLEDDLMRVFASGMVSTMLERTISDEAPIEAKIVTKAIERAQTTVEGKNAESRKDVLKYDDVMNEQRKVLYKRRWQIINATAGGEGAGAGADTLGDDEATDIHEETLELIASELTVVVHGVLESEYHEEWDLTRFLQAIAVLTPTPFLVEDFAGAVTRNDVTDIVVGRASEHYVKKCEGWAGGLTAARFVEREAMLQILDRKWRDHLAEMDYMREGIHLRQVAAQDPLSAWQRDGFRLFGELLARVDTEYVQAITHMSELAPVAGSSAPQYGVTNEAEVAGGAGETEAPPVRSPVKKEVTPGRNSVCPCGSGKKYKMCHGRSGGAGL